MTVTLTTLAAAAFAHIDRSRSIYFEDERSFKMTDTLSPHDDSKVFRKVIGLHRGDPAGGAPYYSFKPKTDDQR